MDSIVQIFFGIILGAILMYWGYGLFGKKKRRRLTEHQSIVLLEKIKSVCKLIAVEGDFAEIYKYEDTKEGFMNLLSSKKKALMVINAKVQIGYDLKKVLMEADNDKKIIRLDKFPQPEILSIEPDLQFYDIKNGLFNTFSSEDLTKLNQQAKEHIKNKVPESGLMDTARKEALETISIIEKIVETIGWKLDYSALEISNREKQFIENN